MSKKRGMSKACLNIGIAGEEQDSKSSYPPPEYEAVIRGPEHKFVIPAPEHDVVIPAKAGIQYLHLSRV